MVNDNKEMQTKNNCEHVTSEFFDIFYNDYIDFKHYINDILNILNERNTTSTIKPSVSKQILLLENEIRTLKLENKNLQEQNKAQLNIIERLTENQNGDFSKKTENDWTTAHPKKNSKGLSSRQNTVPELQNLYSSLQVEDLPPTNLIEENSSTVLSEERNAILDRVIRRRPNICTAERYIKTQQQLQKSKEVPGNKNYAGTLREDKNILMICDSQFNSIYLSIIKELQLQSINKLFIVNKM